MSNLLPTLYQIVMKHEIPAYYSGFIRTLMKLSYSSDWKEVVVLDVVVVDEDSRRMSASNWMNISTPP